MSERSRTGRRRSGRRRRRLRNTDREGARRQFPDPVVISIAPIRNRRSPVGSCLARGEIRRQWKKGSAGRRSGIEPQPRRGWLRRRINSRDLIDLETEDLVPVFPAAPLFPAFWAFFLSERRFGRGALRGSASKSAGPYTAARSFHRGRFP